MKRFTFKPFEEMTDRDYADIGLMCGLEVHQQLLTDRKLFCRCPAGQYTSEFDAEILRHMRPTLSELGEYDGTALMEKKTRKNIYYRLHHDTVCTYEFDDTPPFFMDDVALDISIEIGMLLHLNMVDEVHIARKQYLDGSIPTGFQRTAIIGVDGWIPYKDRKIGMRQLSIEEDACREVSDIGHDRVYLTDRLGMPLIEAVTEPDMRTPQEVADVGQLIRLICRSTGKVRTGYGAGRQDVNVSVRGGTRVEIKGTPQIGRNPRLIYNEAMRQCALLHIRDELKSRGVTEDTLACNMADVSRMLSKTIYTPIRAALDHGQKVKCVSLKKFGGLLSESIQEHTTFSKEFSDRVRVVACLTELPNIVHSDAASETLSGRDWRDLRRKLRADHDDALILVWGSEDDTETACQEIRIRATEATIGIPEDTRQALKDGTSGFERVLPGPQRMYPDTDLPPISITTQRQQTIKQTLPESVWKMEEKIRGTGVREEMIFPLQLKGLSQLFMQLVTELKASPNFTAVVLTQKLKALRRAGYEVHQLTGDEIFETFKTMHQGRFAKEGLDRVFVELLRARSDQSDPAGRVSLAIQSFCNSPATEKDIRSAAGSIIRQLAHERFGNDQDKHRYIMGRLMELWRGRFDGAELSAIVSELLDQSSTSRTQVPA